MIMNTMDRMTEFNWNRLRSVLGEARGERKGRTVNATVNVAAIDKRKTTVLHLRVSSNTGMNVEEVSVEVAQFDDSEEGSQPRASTHSFSTVSLGLPRSRLLRYSEIEKLSRRRNQEGTVVRNPSKSTGPGRDTQSHQNASQIPPLRLKHPHQDNPNSIQHRKQPQQKERQTHRRQYGNNKRQRQTDSEAVHPLGFRKSARFSHFVEYCSSFVWFG